MIHLGESAVSQTPIADVSDTALWVAAFRARESERPDALFHDPLAARLTGERGQAIAAQMPYPKILAWNMAVRTVAIDKLIREALAAGIDTVINLGAGLDTRPYRLELPQALRWVEIDFPSIIALKNTQLQREVPRCRLLRRELDFSQREAAEKMYAELGRETKSALIITEGVIPYLSNEEAGQLAQDLRKIPSFRFWIQDYRKANKNMDPPKKLQTKLKNAPFRFRHADPLGFFRGFGWQERRVINAFDEADRLGRPFPIAFPWNLLMHLMPAARKQDSRQMLGYVLFEANSPA